MERKRMERRRMERKRSDGQRMGIGQYSGTRKGLRVRNEGEMKEK